VSEPQVWPDPDPGWRVRFGAGLVSEMAAQGLLSPEQAERQRREDEREAERERRRVELEAEQRAEAQAERVFELSRQGYTPMTVGERLGLMAEMDVREQHKIARRKELGLPVDDGYQPGPVFEQQRPHRPTRWEVQASVAAAKAEREATPASQADLRRLEGEISHAKALAHAAKTGNASQRSAPAPPDDGLRYRNSGHIVGGPY